MQVGTGKSILNGIAIGKLKIYKKKDTVISTAQVADTAAEEARFEEARAKAIDQQTALYEKALAEAGEDIAEVFNIHAMMLDDDDFVDAIKEIINGQHMCAEYAVKKAGDNQAAVFAAMDDPYLQARSADVIDIAQAMLDILDAGFSPVCPTLFLPLFLRDEIPQEHKDCIDMAREYLRRARVLVVCGSTVDESVKNDIAVAERLRITATTLDGILTVKGQGRRNE